MSKFNAGGRLPARAGFHALSTIRNADLLLVINEGEIVERGTHEELMAKQGFYYNLYMSQFRREPQLGEAIYNYEPRARVPVLAVS